MVILEFLKKLNKLYNKSRQGVRLTQLFCGIFLKGIWENLPAD